MEAVTQAQNVSIPRQAPRMAIKTRGRILFIDPREIIAVEADRNYVLLQQRTGSHLLRESISRMAERLEGYGFVRIHRSVVINSSYVEQIQRWPTGEYVLRILGGKEYTVTRTYKKNLKLMANSWIPTQLFRDAPRIAVSSSG
jgi:two-component system, LytTR family, response regulator